MRIKSAILTVAAIALVAATDVAELPERARPFVTLADKCAAVDELTADHRWEQTFSETFEKVDPKRWRLIDRVEGTKPELVDVDGRSAVRLTVKNRYPMMTTVPAVRGEFAVEAVLQITSKQTQQISLFIDGHGNGPAVELGLNHAFAACLWTDAPPVSKLGHRKVILFNAPVLQRNRWYTIRLEVAGGQVIAYVDDRHIGSHALHPDYNTKRKRYPEIATHQGVIEVDRLTTFSRRDNEPIPRGQAIKKVFGEDVTEAQVAARLEELGDLLDDADYPTRQAARDLIVRAGSLAYPLVRKLRDEGSPEQKMQARTIPIPEPDESDGQ